MNTVAKKKRTPVAIAIAQALALATFSWQSTAAAQEQQENEPAITTPDMPASAQAIDEVVVTGRFLSSSQQLVNERIDDSYASDLLGEDTIGRLGDSTVGAALR
ncbi:MAG: hypothetical protein ACREQ1_00435, partial [Woeseiaceae bacterium]